MVTINYIVQFCNCDIRAFVTFLGTVSSERRQNGPNKAKNAKKGQQKRFVSRDMIFWLKTYFQKLSHTYVLFNSRLKVNKALARPNNKGQNYPRRAKSAKKRQKGPKRAKINNLGVET